MVGLGPPGLVAQKVGRWQEGMQEPSETHQAGVFPQGPAANTKKTPFRSAKSRFPTTRGFDMCLVYSWALEMESYPVLNSEPVLRGSLAKPMSQSPCLEARTPHPQGRAMWVWDHCGEGLVLGRGNLALGQRALMTDGLSQHPDAQGYQRLWREC